jgi:hypothetical protein
MSAMLIPSNDQPSLSDEPPPDSLRAVARARTLSVLTRVDGERKSSVLQFLYESGLLGGGRTVVALRGADLRGANLNGATLQGADLSGADLKNATLAAATMPDGQKYEDWLESKGRGEAGEDSAS